MLRHVGYALGPVTGVPRGLFGRGRHCIGTRVYGDFVKPEIAADDCPSP